MLDDFEMPSQFWMLASGALSLVAINHFGHKRFHGKPIKTLDFYRYQFSYARQLIGILPYPKEFVAAYKDVVSLVQLPLKFHLLMFTRALWHGHVEMLECILQHHPRVLSSEALKEGPSILLDLIGYNARKAAPWHDPLLREMLDVIKRCCPKSTDLMQLFYAHCQGATLGVSLGGLVVGQEYLEYCASRLQVSCGKYLAESYTTEVTKKFLSFRLVLGESKPTVPSCAGKPKSSARKRGKTRHGPQVATYPVSPVVGTRVVLPHVSDHKKPSGPDPMTEALQKVNRRLTRARKAMRDVNKSRTGRNWLAVSDDVDVGVGVSVHTKAVPDRSPSPTPIRDMVKPSFSLKEHSFTKMGEDFYVPPKAQVFLQELKTALSDQPHVKLLLAGSLINPVHKPDVGEDKKRSKDKKDCDVVIAVHGISDANTWLETHRWDFAGLLVRWKIQEGAAEPINGDLCYCSIISGRRLDGLEVDIMLVLSSCEISVDHLIQRRVLAHKTALYDVGAETFYTYALGEKFRPSSMMARGLLPEQDEALLVDGHQAMRGLAFVMRDLVQEPDAIESKVFTRWVEDVPDHKWQAALDILAKTYPELAAQWPEVIEKRRSEAVAAMSL